MARPRSDDRRNAILDTATRIIAAQGLGAPTALIAKEAGISTGSLFTYFETKTELLNQLYIELKAEMALAALAGLPTEQDVRSQMAHMWSGWLHWAISDLNKRRTLAQLSVSDEISRGSREIGHRSMAGVADLLERSRENGPMRGVPLGSSPICSTRWRKRRSTSLSSTRQMLMRTEPALPGTSTLDEAGLGGYALNNWLGFVAPPGTSEAVVTGQGRAIGLALQAARVRQELVAKGVECVAGTPAEFAAHMRHELHKWSWLRAPP